MKNLQISDNDLLGSRFNGHDLHLCLRERGIESNQLVWNKLSKDEHTFELAGKFENKNMINEYINQIQYETSSQSILYPLSYSIIFDRQFLNADIVHYHLIHNGFFNITHLPILTKLKPSVWTLHDPWAVTGRCIHFFNCNRWKEGCGDCPDLDTEFKLKMDATAVNWEIKRLVYQSSEMDLIVSSKWMADIVKESPLTRHFETHIIPFGIDQTLFRPIDKQQAKAAFNIPNMNKVIAFRASTWKLKGLDYIREALLKIEDKRNITLLVSNEKGLVKDLKKNYHIIDLGWIDDTEVIRNYYNAADVFLMPSEAESFGMSAIESMACGTPVIGFSDTVLEDTIGAPYAGIIVKKGSSEQLANAINSLLSEEYRRIEYANNAVDYVQKKYSLEKYLSSIISVYNHVIDKRKVDKRSTYLVNQLSKCNFERTQSVKSLFIPQIIADDFKRRIKKLLNKFPGLYQFARLVYHFLRIRKNK